MMHPEAPQKTFKKPLAALLLQAMVATATPLLISCGEKSPAAVEAKSQEYLDRAESYRQQGQYRAAIIETRNALQKNPNDRAAMLKLASILNELGQGKATIKLLDAARADASREEALAIAQAYLLQQKYRSALDYLADHAQRLNLAQDADANLLRAQALVAIGNLDAAEQLLAKVNRSDLQTELTRLTLLQRRGDTAAQAELDRLLQKYPDDVNVLAEAALQAEQQGRLAEAEDLLSKALMNLPQTDVIVPQKAEILQRLISTLTKLGRSNEALVYAKSLSESNPAGALLQDKLKQGLELFQAGKLDEAEAILTEVYGEAQNETTGMLLGMIRYAKDDLRGAAEYLGDNIDPEIAPEMAVTALAATQLQLAQPDKLLRILGPEERKNIKSPELKMLVGIALLQTGAQAEGEKLVKAAQADQPDNTALQGSLARHYLVSGQADQAIATLETALRKKSDVTLSRMLIAAYVANRDSGKALMLARQLANSAPNNAENWWILGHTAFLLQDFPTAESALQKSLAQQADYAPAELDLGRLYLAQKKNSQAEALYRAVLKHNPERLDATKGLLFALLQQGMSLETAEAELAKSATADNTRLALAEYYLLTQKVDDADKQLAALSHENTSASPQQLQIRAALLRAVQAIEANDIDKARAVIAGSLEKHPNSSELLAFLARIDLHANNLANAKKIADQLAQQQPQPPHVLELQGDVAMREGNAAAAQRYYQTVWKKIPNDAIAQKIHQSLRSDTEAAARFVDEWLQRLPQSSNAHFLRGLLKQQRNDNAGAIADYEAALARNSNDARALNNLAWLYAQAKDKRALETAAKAFALQPQNPAVLDTYGWILVGAGQLDQGIEHLRTAQKLAPDAKEIEQHLNEALKRR